MKVVLFCGGLGLRLRDQSENLPKPMVHIGYRPIIWHIMKYYAHYGHKDFILCLGYKADVVKNYFLNYDECLSNDFVISGGGREREVQLLSSDIDDWSITFVDTGLTANVGQRLKAVEPYLEGEEYFLANYSDGLTDLPLPGYIDKFIKSGKTGCFVAVKPTHSFHVVEIDEDQSVRNIRHLTESGIWINGGFFVFTPEIFRNIGVGEELVVEPFHRLIKKDQLMTQKYDGFWVAMDTFKDKQLLEDILAKGDAPWEVWKHDSGS